MRAQYHPDRYPAVAQLVSGDPSVSGRLNVLRDVTDRWARAEGAIYDLNEISDSISDLTEYTIAELGIDDEAFYVHAGREADVGLGSVGETFVEGIYFIKQSYRGLTGYFVTIITAVGDLSEPTSETAARIACGWINSEQTVEDGLIHLGLWGDPVIIADPKRFDIECFVGQALTKVSRMIPKAATLALPTLN